MSLTTSSLFDVSGLVAVITGGATGMSFPSPSFVPSLRRL